MKERTKMTRKRQFKTLALRMDAATWAKVDAAVAELGISRTAFVTLVLAERMLRERAMMSTAPEEFLAGGRHVLGLLYGVLP